MKHYSNQSISKAKYRFCLWKRYFETGYSITNFFKYFIFIFGFYDGFKAGNLKLTFILAFFYIIFCFFLGHYWLKYGYFEAEQEVSNRFNPFVKEVRGKIKNKKFK